MKKLTLTLVIVLSFFTIAFALALETITDRENRRQSDEYQARQDASPYQINRKMPGIND